MGRCMIFFVELLTTASGQSKKVMHGDSVL